VIPDGRIRVLVADDHPGVRRKVRQALESSDVEVVGDTATADGAVEMSLRLVPDVALLDVNMPGGGIRAARAIADDAPTVTVIMLTQSDDDDDLFDALRAGAAGYLLKTIAPTRLGDALRGALGGEVAMSPRLVAKVLDEFRNPRQRLFARRSAAAAKLSAREWEIMTMLGAGRTTEQVAKALFLSPTTVRVHVSSVLRKLAVKDRESAFRLLRG
jgi:DNA-binding NarL/FixJ family response regulator